MIRVHFHPVFLKFTEGKKEVSVSGKSGKELLCELFSLFPAIKDMILDEEGRLKRHILLIVNGVAMRPESFPSLRLDGGEEIFITISVGGG